MAGSPKLELGRAGSCLLCHAWKDEMIALVEHRATVCRPCAAKLGHTILATGSTIVARLWPASPPTAGPQRDPPPTNVNAEEMFSSFREGVAKEVGVEDAQTHLDLAVAYGDMGLMVDAVREAAIAVGERASLPIASRALNWLFARGRAHPDALSTIVDRLQQERGRLH